MKYSVRYVMLGALACALVGTLVMPPAQMPEAQEASPGVQSPHLDLQGSAQPSVVDPTTMPGVSAAYQGRTKAMPILSPDPDARKAALEGRGPAGPDFDRPSSADEHMRQPGSTSGGANLPGPNFPAVSFSFNGINEGQSGGFIPPDQAIAVGPNHIVEQNNSVIQIFDKNGVAQFGSPISLQSWYANPPTNFVFDPVGVTRHGVAFIGDQLRFYEVALFLDTGTKDSRVMVAISANNNALSARCVYHFPGRFFNSTADDAFTDFPKVGVTYDPGDASIGGGSGLGNSRLLISGNLFRFSNFSYVTNTVFEINKRDLDKCQGAAFTRWTGFTNSDNSVGFTTVPATDYDDTGAYGWYTAQTKFGAGNVVTVWRNRFGVGFERFGIPTLAYTNPPAATQQGSGALIDTIDDRLQSAVLRYGKTWIIHAMALGGCGAGNDTAVLHLASIDTPKSAAAPSLSEGPSVPTSPGFNPLLDLIYAGPCATHQFNGAVSQDSHGNALFVYTESGNAERAHPRINGFHLVENSLGPLVVLGAGPGANVETRGRWGDYSGAALDPLDQRFVWVASEILLGNNFWGTRIGKIIWSGLPL